MFVCTYRSNKIIGIFNKKLTSSESEWMSEKLSKHELKQTKYKWKCGDEKMHCFSFSFYILQSGGLVMPYLFGIGMRTSWAGSFCISHSREFMFKGEAKSPSENPLCFLPLDSLLSCYVAVYFTQDLNESWFWFEMKLLQLTFNYLKCGVASLPSRYEFALKFLFFIEIMAFEVSKFSLK